MEEINKLQESGLNFSLLKSNAARWGFTASMNDPDYQVNCSMMLNDQNPEKLYTITEIINLLNGEWGACIYEIIIKWHYNVAKRDIDDLEERKAQVAKEDLNAKIS